MLWQIPEKVNLKGIKVHLGSDFRGLNPSTGKMLESRVAHLIKLGSREKEEERGREKRWERRKQGFSFSSLIPSKPPAYGTILLIFRVGPLAIS